MASANQSHPPSAPSSSKVTSKQDRRARRRQPPGVPPCQFPGMQFTLGVGVQTPPLPTSIPKHSPAATKPKPVSPPPPAPKTGKDLAEKIKPTTEGWVSNALLVLKSYEDMILAGFGDPLKLHATTVDALNTHFHLDKSKNSVTLDLATIRKTFSDVADALKNSATIFKNVDLAAAAAAFQKSKDPNFVAPPAYTFFKGHSSEGIYFTPLFKTPRVGNQGFGPNCLAAMVLHECVHYVDQNAPDYAYEHQGNPLHDTPFAPLYTGPDYENLPPQHAMHNPSSYACFAAHLVKGSDKPRYGAGNPSL